MDFNQSVNKAVDEVVQKFVKEVSLQYNIDIKELQNIWSGKNNSTTQKRSKVVPLQEESSEDVYDDAESESDKDKSLNMDSLQKCTVPELKAFCKERGLKCTGKKSDLLSRLIDYNKSGTDTSVQEKASPPKVSKKNVDTKNVIKKLKENSSSTLQVRRNAFGNYQHPHTSLIFNEQGKVYGVQNDDGSVDALSEDSIDLCNKYNLEFVIPDNLDAGVDNDNIEIDEIDDKSDEEDDSVIIEDDDDDISEDDLVVEEEEEIPLDDDDDDEDNYY